MLFSVSVIIILNVIILGVLLLNNVDNGCLQED